MLMHTVSHSSLHRLNSRLISLNLFKLFLRFSSSSNILNKMENSIIFSGIQPTGDLHIGNYLGAVKKWVQLQGDAKQTIFSIVDLHAITLPQDPSMLHTNILHMVASLIACGIDPEKSIIFQQSTVSEHSQLNWVFSCLTTMSRLGHLPQYKEKSQALKDIPLGLFVYPVLQASDILLYDATHVPVGEDQLQHIQLTSQLAKSFNNKFGLTFVSPKALLIDDYSVRIKSLRQPLKKMSKSEVDPHSRLCITNDPDLLRQSLKKAVTDFTSSVYFDYKNRPGVSNLMVIHSAVTGKSFTEIEKENEQIDTGKYKMVIADAVIEYFKPIRQEIQYLCSNPSYLMNILNLGTEKAKEIASKKWKDVKMKLGLSKNV